MESRRLSCPAYGCKQHYGHEGVCHPCYILGCTLTRGHAIDLSRPVEEDHPGAHLRRLPPPPPETA